MLPDRPTAEALLQDAEVLNPGRWAPHSRRVAQAAQRIAAHHASLDPERAYVLGLLHDLGRRTGPNRDRHILDGFDYLCALGYADAARIALTHSFAVPDLQALQGQWDGTPQEHARLGELLRGVNFNEEDRLIQLCDLLAMHDGFCTVQERLVDIGLRYGINRLTPSRWAASMALKTHFDERCGENIYRLLPGLTERLLR